jgi:hypothetical protein
MKKEMKKKGVFQLLKDQINKLSKFHHTNLRSKRRVLDDTLVIGSLLSHVIYGAFSILESTSHPTPMAQYIHKV